MQDRDLQTAFLLLDLAIYAKRVDGAVRQWKHRPGSLNVISRQTWHKVTSALLQFYSCIPFLSSTKSKLQYSFHSNDYCAFFSTCNACVNDLTVKKGMLFVIRQNKHYITEFRTLALMYCHGVCELMFGQKRYWADNCLFATRK